MASLACTKKAHVVSTYTNTRKTGNLELMKSPVPSTDPRPFPTRRTSDPSTKASASNVGDGGTTGAGGTSLPTGSYDLSETAGTSTSLSDYDSALACKNCGDNSVAAVSSSGSVTLAKDADVVCTYTNTRQTGKLELKNSLVPSTASGLFTLSLHDALPI